ncbi:TraB/GumN family protein [Erwinia sp. V71]|uniref:TraB/GumN family protein n=1 Tax=Erwinia sp. V71 TaxID=3369424 RepID=UPI003F61FE63
MAKWLCKVTSLIRSFSAVSYTYPALDVALPAGRQLHLVGSIHMGTRDMMPLPGQLLRSLDKADALIVEADITRGASPFSDVGSWPALAQRLSPDNLAILQRLCDELSISTARVDTLPGWQVALMLQAQQAQRLGLRPDYGIDYQLLQAARARGIAIIELEGPDEQLALLNALPDNGMALLEDTLQHWHTNARLLQTMVIWWLETPPRQHQIVLPTTFSSELNDVLMNQRNQRWTETLSQLTAGRYVVAVGALHLYGEGNLPDLLQGR